MTERWRKSRERKCSWTNRCMLKITLKKKKNNETHYVAAGVDSVAPLVSLCVGNTDVFAVGYVCVSAHPVSQDMAVTDFLYHKTWL